MKPLILLFLFSSVRAFDTACAFGHGQWEPKPGQCFALVMRELGTNRQQIEDLNPGIDLDDIFPSVPYNVPYNAPKYSAVWINGCPPMLQLPDDADYPNSVVCGNEQSTTSQPLSSTSKASARPSSPYAGNEESTMKGSTTTSVSRRPALPLSSVDTVQSQHEGDKKIMTSLNQESASSSTALPTGETSTSLNIESYKKTIRLSRTGSVASSTEGTDNVSRTLPTTEATASSGALSTTDKSEPCTTPSTIATATSITLPAGHCSKNLISPSTYLARETTALRDTTLIKKTTTSLVTSAAEGSKATTTSPDTQSNTETTTSTTTQSTEAMKGTTSTAISSPIESVTSSVTSDEQGSLTTSLGTTSAGNPAASSVTTSTQKAKQTTETSDAQSTTVSAERTKPAVTTTIVSSIETKISSATTTTTTSDEPSVVETSPSSVASSLSYTSKPKTTLLTTKTALLETATATTADLSQTTVPAPICGDENELLGHGDTSKNGVKRTAFLWCNSNQNKEFLGAGDECFIGVQWSNEVAYEYSVCRAKDCVGGIQDLKQPLGSDGPSCKDIMFQNWRLCTGNGGVGGVTQAGCLLYKFRGGVGDLQGYKRRD